MIVMGLFKNLFKKKSKTDSVPMEKEDVSGPSDSEFEYWETQKYKDFIKLVKE